MRFLLPSLVATTSRSAAFVSGIELSLLSIMSRWTLKATTNRKCVLRRPFNLDGMKRFFVGKYAVDVPRGAIFTHRTQRPRLGCFGPLDTGASLCLENRDRHSSCCFPCFETERGRVDRFARGMVCMFNTLEDSICGCALPLFRNRGRQLFARRSSQCFHTITHLLERIAV